jgi:hypothetical protein
VVKRSTEDLRPLEKIPPKPPTTKFSKRGYYWLRSRFLAPKISKKGLLLSLIRKDLLPVSTNTVVDLRPLEKIPRKPPTSKFSKRGYYWLRSTILAPKFSKKGLLLSLIRKDVTPVSTSMVEDLGPLEKIPRKPPSLKFSKRGYYWLRSVFLAPKIFKKGLLLSSIRKDCCSITTLGGTLWRWI